MAVTKMAVKVAFLLLLAPSVDSLPRAYNDENHPGHGPRPKASPIPSPAACAVGSPAAQPVPSYDPGRGNEAQHDAGDPPQSGWKPGDQPPVSPSPSPLASPSPSPLASPSLSPVASPVGSSVASPAPAKSSPASGTLSIQSIPEGVADSPCNNLQTNLSVPCWDELKVDKHLEDFWRVNGSKCEAMETSFASCYQQSLGITQQACDTIGPDHCDFPLNFDREGYTPQQSYALYSIFALWQWFNSLYAAILNADVSANGPVGTMIRMINPIKPTKKPLMDILAALTALTPMIAFPATWGAWGLFKTHTMLEGTVRQSPFVARTLNPTGTLDSQFVEMTKITEGLGVIKDTYQQNISQALEGVQANLTNFQSMTAHGGFIAPKSDLQAQTEGLTRNLNTYIASQALTESNIVITMARDTDPLALATNGSLTNPDLMDCKEYDARGMCGEWWYDPTINTAFALSNIGDPTKSYRSLLNDLFDKGWFGPQDLFGGAKACADYQAVKGAPNTPALDPESMTVKCVSNTQVCVYKQDCEYSQECLYTGEYGGLGSDRGGACNPPKGFIQDGCAADDYMRTFNVPRAYLGPLSTNTDPLDVVCVH